MDTKTRCSVKGCGEPIAIRKHGLCTVHVQRFYRTGSPGPAPIRRNRRLTPFRGAKS